jgi:hypothetical protein
MARLRPLTANPAADAASLLRRIGFAILMMVVPVLSLVTRRAVVVLAPVGIILLVLAAFLEGSSRPVKERLRHTLLSPGGLAACLALGWCILSLVWTPFRAEAFERLVNLIGVVVVMIAGYLSLPERMRSANLYVLPVGVAFAALCALVLGFLWGRGRADAEDVQNLARGLIVLVLFLWPAVGWLRSRGRHIEALLLAVGVALATLVGPEAMPLQALAAGALAFAVAAISPRLGTTVTAVVIAGLLLFAPLLPLAAAPVAKVILGGDDPIYRSLQIWRSVVAHEPLRLITGHGFETALRGRTVGLLAPQAPITVLFEIWYELGFVGAAAGSCAIYRAVRSTGQDHVLIVPAIMAAFTTAFAFACLGIGTAQIWWFTALAVIVLLFVATERGQFRTTRPKATLLRNR